MVKKWDECTVIEIYNLGIKEDKITENADCRYFLFR